MLAAMLMVASAMASALLISEILLMKERSIHRPCRSHRGGPQQRDRFAAEQAG
jgi:hypothetical protein